MCFPAAIPLVMGAATAGLGIFQQQQEASYQNKVAEQTNKANALAAARAYNIESASQQAGVDEARTQANQSRVQNALQATQAQGAALARFGSSGVGGGALDSVLADYARQSGQANAELGQSLRFTGQNAELQRRGTFERTVNEAAIHKIPKSPGLTAAGIGGSILSGVNTGLAIYPTT